jgi:hypothetical protein
VTSLVYVLAKTTDSVDEESLKTVGTTTSALDGDTVSTHDVLGTADSTDVWVEADEGSFMTFERVTRTFSGREYALASGAITTFGTWPSLPPGVSPPTNADGSPQYVEAGTDSLGVTVYRATNADASVGIAVAPGAPADDPAAGNPGWTWWVPVAE